MQMTKTGLGIFGGSKITAGDAVTAVTAAMKLKDAYSLEGKL